MSDAPPLPPGFVRDAPASPAAPPMPPGFVLEGRDQSTGAPGNVRQSVGAAQTPEDRLATIRRFYPDAQPHGDGNFIFRNPRTGQPTLYNPPGLDLGDVLSVAPEIGEGIGGFIGGALAAPAAVAGAPATGGLSALAVPAGIGLGAAAGREIATLGANLLGNTVDTRGPLQRLTDAGTTAGINAAVVPATDLASRGLRALLGPFRGRGAASLDDFTQAGVRASAGDVTGNPGTQNLQSAISAAPSGARRMIGFNQGQTDDLGNAVTRQAEGIGVPTTSQIAGGTLREGAGRAVTRFDTRSRDLYDDAFARVGADSRVSFPAVQRLRGEIAAALAQAPQSAARRLQPVLDRMDNLLADAGPDGLVFDAMRRERTALGETIGRPAVSATQAETEGARYLRQLYGALTEDMTAHAQAAGGDAARALALADRYTRFNRTVNLPVLERLQRQSTDQQVFDLAFPRSGRPDAQTLSRITRNMTPEERSTLSATVLDRMGMPTPGAAAGEDFSAATFLTNWNRLTHGGPAARRVLFGPEDAELGRNLDRLVRVASAMRETQRLTNWSNTARNVAGLGVISAVGTAGANAAMTGDLGTFAQTVGVTLLAPAVGARLLTSPAFVGWLASAGPTLVEQGATPAIVQSLARIGAVNPELRDAVSQYQAIITSQPPTRPPTR